MIWLKRDEEGAACLAQGLEVVVGEEGSDDVVEFGWKGENGGHWIQSCLKVFLDKERKDREKECLIPKIV